MTSGARLPGEAILADDDLREMRIVPLKFMIPLFAKRGLTPELSRAAKWRRTRASVAQARGRCHEAASA